MKKQLINIIYIIKRIVLYFLTRLRFYPHVIVLKYHYNRSIIYDDIERWLQCYNMTCNRNIGFIYLMKSYPEFRSLFYYRVGDRWLLNLLAAKMESLYIYTNHIGRGIFIQHGFSTIILAKSIGDNCWINQQVTIGYSNKTDAPTILNNVTIHAGAKIIGKVTIGNNCIIGANCVVVKSIPDNCTVVGVPAYIIKRNGIKVKESL